MAKHTEPTVARAIRVLGFIGKLKDGFTQPLIKYSHKADTPLQTLKDRFDNTKRTEQKLKLAQSGCPLPSGTLCQCVLSQGVLSSVAGFRIVTDTDTDISYRSLYVPTVRSLTGQDAVKIGGLTAKLTCSIICGTNNMPDVAATKEWAQVAMFRQLAVIPMTINATALPSRSQPHDDLDALDFALSCACVRARFTNAMPVTLRMVLIALLGSRFDTYADLLLLDDVKDIRTMSMAVELIAKCECSRQCNTSTSYTELDAFTPASTSKHTNNHTYSCGIAFSRKDVT